MAETPSFSTPQEEIEYWKRVADDYRKNWEEAKEELDEFQISSQELEAELETQLEAAEGKVKELTAAKERLQNETDNLKEKLEHSQNEYLRQINELQDELAQIKAIREELTKYIRELEQHNDDLERAKRTTVTSLEDFEARLNLAIERNAFLENELDEKETLEVTIQRMKDEARDMAQELAVQGKMMGGRSTQAVPDNDRMDTTPQKHGDTRLPETDNKVLHEAETNTTPGLNRVTEVGGSSGNTPLTASARISALNIVGDLLRKVGALETKLASCRNFVKDQPRRANSPVDSPRAAKRANRTGASSSTLQGMVKITV
ncbi:nuclear distribution protein nudE-like 1-A [Acanthaster planci]|uniref:Nuclear distribution protein nudE-like 1-A n=1 Tax=Acanthaster planci TaxID=133434 RepID=A0A8B7ZJL1_ACAPL|nr:nuclear distribution protein nudE-like 1-A [Acanthaster planci]